MYLMLKQTADPNGKSMFDHIFYVKANRWWEGKSMHDHIFDVKTADPNGKPFICRYGEILFKLLKHLKWYLNDK